MIIANLKKNKNHGEFPGSPVVRLGALTVRVQSLVGELRYPKARSKAKKKLNN